MASKKLGNLIKEARTEAGLTQEQLARKIAGLSASEISAAERGVGDLTQDQLKKIAKATGVTQASLLTAAKGSSKSTSTAATSSMQVTATERRLVEAYRKASAQEKKAAMNALKGTGSLTEEIFEAVLDSVDTKDILEDLLEGVLKK